MNLILFSGEELDDDQRLLLSDDRFRHIRDTLSAGIGDPVKVGLINGLTGLGRINHIDDECAAIDVTLTEAPPPKLPLSVLLALPRPKMLRRIFRSVAELGVAELHIINTARVEKSYWQSPALKPDAVRRYLLDGLQQARDTVLPAVSFHRLFKPFVEDELPALAANTVKLLAHPGTGEPCPNALDAPVTLAIGPEGGFTAYEVEKLIAADFAGIDLGPRILRVENALTALCSRLYSC